MPTTPRRSALVPSLWVLIVLMVAAVAVMTFAWTPVERTMGPAQKVFYVHFPMAINTFVAFLVCFIGSIGFLYTRNPRWDALAVAGAHVGVVLCTVVLLTGMIWARSAWGYWWTWSPRLTFSLVLWLLYVVYLMIRPSIAVASRRALVSAVYGIVAFLDVPLVYLSVRLIPDIHPKSIELAPEMKATAWAWFAPVTLFAAVMIYSRFILVRQQDELQMEYEEDATATSPVTAGDSA